MELFNYLIWSGIGLTLFYGVYHFAFNEQTPPRAHRFYLISTIMATLILPLIPFRLPFSLSNELPRAVSDLQGLEVITGSVATQEAPTMFTTGALLSGVYILLASGIIFRTIWHLVKLWRLFKKCERQPSDGIIIATHDSIETAFSFFHFVFLQKGAQEEAHGQQIIAHERIHARELHSIDIILSEILCAILWFHPLAWILKNRITLIHEYLADDGVLKTGVNKLSYQALLLNQIAEGRLICLASNFNNSLIKKRILMMSKSNVNSRSGLRLLVLIPITLVLCFAIACTSTEDPAPEADELNIPPPPPPLSEKEMSFDNATFVVDGKEMSKAEVNKIGAENIKTVNVVKGEQGNTLEIVTKGYEFKKNVSYENAKKLYVVDGEVQNDDFDVSSIGKENIKSVNIIGVEDQIKKYTDGDYDRVVLIETK